MMRTIEIKNIKIAGEGKTLSSGSLLVQEGKIQAISSEPIGGADLVIDGAGKNWSLVPGFIDVHIHGAGGYDVMDATSEALEGITKQLPAEGTTSFLATTMTQSSENISCALKNAASFIEKQYEDGSAEVLGVHLEGPFIAKNKAGAQPLEHISSPSISQFNLWQKESGGTIRLVTLAPEVEGGLELIEHLTKSGVTASIGHSEATYIQVEKAVEKGARHITHLFNQMSGLHHREPGVVGAALLNDKLKVEMIVDYVHSRPEAVKLAYQNTHAARTILITDAMRAKCLPEGTYDLGGQQVEVQGKEARLKDGTLAGSILTLDEAVRNMKSNLNLSLEDIVKITSSNAAEQLNVIDRKGSIAEGKDADLVIMDENFEVIMTLCRGVMAYQREEKMT
ncbi:N-acetylglucosamine-6-phosphate deacetylase [Halobacillus massiliensis]|uniref:N-acetylglucosamine-6-phosphate deacetylase n=1 Tax=Halobacillus massiliensis TaxID=1926286 RepID=UPI0009E2A3B8|nr:N-acetylglucosamine-6-phosphate deacetylase [Halobacillus massiliensis]